MSKTTKGNYYRLRTKKWFEKEGYAVENLERRQRVFTKGRVVYIAHDIWGADLVAMDGDEIVFIQVKSNKGDIAKGMKELAAHPYPSCVRLQVVYWEPRSREPTVTVVQ